MMFKLTNEQVHTITGWAIEKGNDEIKTVLLFQLMVNQELALQAPKEINNNKNRRRRARKSR